MEKYLGVKLVEAEPQLKGYSLGMTKPNQAISEHDFNIPGYKVVYDNGYISWSPKEVFEKDYRKTENLTFGLAIAALKQGRGVARQGWNGKGLFVFYSTDTPGLMPHFVLNNGKNCNTWVPSITDCLAEDWIIVRL